MPLFIKGQLVDQPPVVDTFVKTYSHFKKSSQRLLEQDVQIVGPEGLLYIGQREVAGTSPSDDCISIIGSEDATTCHICVLRHTGSGAASLIHFDGSSIEEGLKTMITLVIEQTENMDCGRLEVHLVGGFLDPRGNSHEVSNQVLRALRESSYDLHLETACITHFNTTYDDRHVPYPVIYGIACNIKTGEIFRATFPEKGPDLTVRSARHFTGGSDNIVIYDYKSKHLVIGPFSYESLPNLDIYLSMPDKAILKYLSTSPEQEPETFVSSVRSSLMQIRDFPDPINSVFQRKSHRYKKDIETGAWVLIQS